MLYFSRLLCLTVHLSKHEVWPDFICCRILCLELRDGLCINLLTGFSASILTPYYKMSHYLNRLSELLVLLTPLIQMVKCLPTVQNIRVRSLGWEDSLEKDMAIHSRTIAWKIPWKEEPGKLQSMGSQRVGHDRAASLRPSLRPISVNFNNANPQLLLYQSKYSSGDMETG